MNDQQFPDDADDTIRKIIAGTREVLAVVGRRPMDTIVAGDLLRGIMQHAEGLAVRRVACSKDGTSISAESVRLLLERYPSRFASLLVRLRTEEGATLDAVRRSVRDHAASLIITVDSLLASSTFAGVPGGRAA